MEQVYLGLGSNLGDRQANIQMAVTRLQQEHIHTFKHSSIIETDPVGGPPQDKYLNAVIEVQTNYNPQDLLKITQSIEKSMGRVKTVPNGARIIDIDILLYKELKIETHTLTIPHPRIGERSFVLIPLTEIAPNLVKNKYANI